MSDVATRAEYQSPLSSRYATAAMLENFSDRRRALLWRDLWIALARAEASQQLPVSAAQIAALEATREDYLFSPRTARHARPRPPKGGDRTIGPPQELGRFFKVATVFPTRRTGHSEWGSPKKADAEPKQLLDEPTV